MRMISGADSRRLQSGDPQFLQKQRLLPGEDSNSATESEPVRRVKYLVRTGALETKAPP
jgi:hypothetical protein